MHNLDHVLVRCLSSLTSTFDFALASDLALAEDFALASEARARRSTPCTSGVPSALSQLSLARPPALAFAAAACAAASAACAAAAYAAAAFAAAAR